jgi:hypothetical protein
VIGQDDGREADLPAATGDIESGHSAIKGSRAVQMEINPDSDWTCTHRQVGYYRAEEGSGKGSPTLGTWRGGSWLRNSA